MRKINKYVLSIGGLQVADGVGREAGYTVDRSAVHYSSVTRRRTTGRQLTCESEDCRSSSTQRKQPLRGHENPTHKRFKPRNVLLWGDSANRRATVPPINQTLFSVCFPDKPPELWLFNYCTGSPCQWTLIHNAGGSKRLIRDAEWNMAGGGERWRGGVTGEGRRRGRGLRLRKHRVIHRSGDRGWKWGKKREAPRKIWRSCLNENWVTDKNPSCLSVPGWIILLLFFSSRIHVSLVMQTVFPAEAHLHLLFKQRWFDVIIGPQILIHYHPLHPEHVRHSSCWSCHALKT